MSEGGCECGAIRYRLVRPPIFVNCCHCRQCQKVTGSAFALNAMIEAEAVELLRGAPAEAAGTRRCAGCGTLLWATHRLFGDGIVFVRAGTLDEAERLAPEAHFFVRSKHPWVTIPPGARTFDTLPGEGDAPLLDAEAEARLARERRPG